MSFLHSKGIRKCFCITHTYLYEQQNVYIASFGDMDAIRASVYCQFMYETHFDETGTLSSLEIAALLCMFYGFCQCGHDKNCTVIEMFSEREKLCGSRFKALMNDIFLHRNELLIALKYIWQQNLCKQMLKSTSPLIAQQCFCG